MKQIFLKAWLILACLLVGVGESVAVTYKLQQVTSVSAGEKYVFVQDTHAFGSTVSNNALQTVEGYKTTGLAGTEAYVWTLETATGGFYMKNVSLTTNKYLNNSSKTNVSFGSASSVWTFDFTDTDAVLIQNKSNSSRYLGYTTAESYMYKAYATSDMSYPHAIKVYKLVEETGGGTTPISYTITIDEDIINGSVSASHTSATENTVVTLTATPYDGYEFASWNVTNVSTGASISVTNNKFSMPAANVNVSAVFQEKAVRPENEIFYESFDTNKGTGGNDNQWSGSIASSDIKQDNEGWDFVSAKGAYKCAKFGAGSALGSATTPALGHVGSATLTFKAAAWNGSSENTTLKLSIVGGGSISSSTVTMKKGEWSEYELTLSDLTADSKVKFAGNTTSNSRFFLDEISVIKGKVTPTLSFANPSYDATVGEAFVEPTLYNPQGVTVAYTSSDENVATVNASNGEVELKAEGTTTIAATFAGDENYNAASASYQIVVAPAKPTYEHQVLALVAQNEEGYYATFSSSEVTFWSEDYVVSAVSAEDGTLVKFDNDDAFDQGTVEIESESVKGYYVPANTGVLVYSLEALASYYTVTGVTPSNDVAAVNMLVPTTSTTCPVVAGDNLYYKLAYGDFESKTKLGFWWGAEDGSGMFNVKAGGAVLVVPAAAGSVRGFSFDGEDTTGIESLAGANEAQSTIYNLQGVRMQKLVRGVNIMNGRKVLR